MVSRPYHASKVIAVPVDNAPLTVFVTGCASGIGRHLADALLDAGHRLWATDIAIENLRTHAASRGWPSDRSVCAELDVSDANAWQRCYAAAIAHFGDLDLHINVAGYLQPGWIDSISLAEIDRHIDVNIRGVAYGTALAARHMCARGRGQIINVASLAGIAAIPGIAIYSATKHAVRGLSLAAAAELQERGIKVTTVSPDAVQTPMLDLQVGDDAAALTFSGGRPLRTEEVVQAILGDAMRNQSLEVALPRGRAWLARIAGLFPASTRLLQRRLQRRGAATQARLRKRKERNSHNDR